MSVFWQHIGASNSVRDLPRTIGKPETGLCEFVVEDVRRLLSELSPMQDAELARNIDSIGETHFQIWGLPTGAGKTLSKMETGDYLMLLDTNAEWGAFKYMGRVLYLLPGEHWDLSLHLWKERTFPLIVFLRGQLIRYPWSRFLTDFKFGPGMKPMGRTYRISEKAFSEGPSPTDAQFFEYVVGQFPPYSEFFVSP